MSYSIIGCRALSSDRNGSANLGARKACRPCFPAAKLYVSSMELTYTQDLAIQAKVASVIGAKVFDKVFAGVRFAETDGPLLYVYARNEECAADIEDDFSLLIANIASRVLNYDVELVVVLPKVLQ